MNVFMKKNFLKLQVKWKQNLIKRHHMKPKIFLNMSSNLDKKQIN